MRRRRVWRGLFFRVCLCAAGSQTFALDLLYQLARAQIEGERDSPYRLEVGLLRSVFYHRQMRPGNARKAAEHLLRQPPLAPQQAYCPSCRPFVKLQHAINDQGFEVEGRYLLEAYLEVDSSGASFTFRGIFGRELLSGTEFNIEISQGGHTWKLAGVRQGSCIVLRGEKDTAVLLRCLLGEGTVKIRVQGCGSCGEDFSFSAEPGNFAELRDMCANTRDKNDPPAIWPAGLLFLFVILSFCPSSDYRSAC